MWAIARRPDPWRDAVCSLASDVEAGLVPGWPNAYNNQIVDGVRYMLAEVKACQSDLMAGIGD